MPDEVIIPPVRAFRDVEASKAQALKPLEEAAEVFGAWQTFYECPTKTNRELLVDECCDIIVATCNLLAALGVSDLTYAMADCERRNEVRGRYGE